MSSAYSLSPADFTTFETNAEALQHDGSVDEIDLIAADAAGESRAGSSA